jgi:zinc transport system substrate-binding protein
VIFSEELVSPKIAETIAKETGARTQILNPLEGLSEEAIAAGEDYFSVMQANLEKLKEALE